MYKYHAYLLACIILVWAVILAFVLRTWLMERRNISPE